MLITIDNFELQNCKLRLPNISFDTVRSARFDTSSDDVDATIRSKFSITKNLDNQWEYIKTGKLLKPSVYQMILATNNMRDNIIHHMNYWLLEIGAPSDTFLLNGNTTKTDFDFYTYKGVYFTSKDIDGEICTIDNWKHILVFDSTSVSEGVLNKFGITNKELKSFIKASEDSTYFISLVKYIGSDNVEHYEVVTKKEFLSRFKSEGNILDKIEKSIVFDNKVFNSAIENPDYNKEDATKFVNNISELLEEADEKDPEIIKIPKGSIVEEPEKSYIDRTKVEIINKIIQSNNKILEMNKILLKYIKESD